MRIFALILLILLVQGCATATDPDLIAPSTTTSRNFASLDCSALFDLREKNKVAYKALYDDQRELYIADRGYHISAWVLGLVAPGFLNRFLWGFLGLGVEGDSELDVNQLSQAKADGIAIDKSLTSNGCS